MQRLCCVQQAVDYVAGFFDSEYCLYGDNCGMNCEHYTYDENDPLDTACYEHDNCLKSAESEEATCECDDKLIRTADEVRAAASLVRKW